MAAKPKFVVPPPEELDAVDSTNLGALSRFKAQKQKNQVTAEKASDTDANLPKTVTETIRQEYIPTKRKVPHSDSESEINKRQQIEDLLQQNETPNETKLPPKVITKTNSILVNSRQRGNPILKFVRNVPFEYTDIIPDYVMGQTTCALFLSLRYHILKPDYIHERLKQLGRNYKLRVLLVQVDVKDSHHAIKQLTKIAILAKCTLMLAWSPEEAGRFLEIYKVFENKPPDALMGKTETDPLLKLTDAISSVKPVNRTNATSLLTTFKSFDRIVAATPEELSFCPGMGIHKAKKLHAVLNQPFVESKTKNT